MFGWLTTLLNALATQPPLLLAVVALPVLVVMIFAKTYPTRQLVAFMIVPALTSLGLLVKQDLLPLILVIDAVLALFFVADLFSIPRPGAIAVERSCRRIGSLRKNHPVTLTITNLSRRTISLMVRDDIPEEF